MYYYRQLCNSFLVLRIQKRVRLLNVPNLHSVLQSLDEIRTPKLILTLEKLFCSQIGIVHKRSDCSHSPA
jgi:hypothetical protein